MRPLLPGDLDCAVAVVMAQPPEARADVAARLLAQADLADRYRKRLGRAHPHYGTGSLMSAALCSLICSPPFKALIPCWHLETCWSLRSMRS